MLQAPPPPDPPAAEEVVVTGRALPDPIAEEVYEADRVGRQGLANSPTHQLDEILKAVPGVQLFRRSDSTSGHPTSQGVTLRSLGGNASSRALLVLDGVPQADPFGGWVNWPAYDPASLAQVRVVRGGGSVSSGPGALAGVIEMSSISEARTNGSIEVGTRESIAGRAFFGTEVGRSLLAANVQASRSAGFIPVTEGTRGPADRRAPYREGSVRARWVAPLARDVEVQAGVLAFTDVRERGLAFTGNRTRGVDTSIRIVSERAVQWSATAYAQWRNFRSSFASVNDDRSEAVRVALQDSVPSSSVGGSFEIRPRVGASAELRVGADARAMTGESRELYAFVAGDPTRRRAAGGDSSTQGIFAEGSWTLGQLRLSGGARIDHWTISDGELFEQLIGTGEVTRNDSFEDRDGWLPTARAGAVLGIGGGFSLRSAAYLGWRLPTLNELFRPFRAGADATAANALLDPERLAGAEAGVRYGRGAVELSVTAFANRISDSIANVTLAHGPGLFPGVGFVAGNYRQRLNVDAVKVHGIEASAEARRGDFSLIAGASYSDAEVQAGGVASALDGLRPAQTAKLALSGEVAWRNGGRAASLLVRHVGPQFEDDLNLVKLPSATTVDLFAAWPLGDRLQLVARAENLFNETVVAGIDEDAAVERATPRTLWIGLRLADF